MNEPLRVDHEHEVKQEMEQWRLAIETLSGFFILIQPVQNVEISRSRVRFYNALFESCMKQIELEEQIILTNKGAEAK
jgi:hypothetical protein